MEEANDYGDALAGLIMQAMDGDLNRRQFQNAMTILVNEQLTAAFRQGANVPDDDQLLQAEQAALNEELALHQESIERFTDELFGALVDA